MRMVRFVVKKRWIEIDQMKTSSLYLKLVEGVKKKKPKIRSDLTRLSQQSNLVIFCFRTGPCITFLHKAFIPFFFLTFSFHIQELLLHMTTDTEAAPTPAGYVFAGKVSDFMPLSPSPSQAPSHDDQATSEGDQTSATVCPVVVGDCSVKGEGKDIHMIKVIEISQPAELYPPTKRVAVTYFHGKWYAFLNVSV